MSCSLEEPNAANSTTVQLNGVVESGNNNEKSIQGQTQQQTGPNTQTITLTGAKPVVSQQQTAGTIMVGLGSGDHHHFGQHQNHHHHHHQQQAGQQTLITLQPPSQPLQIIQPNVLNNSNSGGSSGGSTTTYATLSNVATPTKMLNVNTGTTAAKLASGGHYVITTLSTAGSAALNQKLVTVSQNHSSSNPATVTIISNGGGNGGASSSATASSSSNEQSMAPATTTITLSSPPPPPATPSSASTGSQSGAGQSANPSILFPLQPQYTSFIDTSASGANDSNANTTCVNLFSPLGSSNNSYYTFQQTSTYPQQSLITTTSSSNNSGSNQQNAASLTSPSGNRQIIQEQQSQPQNNQQSQQPQQTVYLMYDSGPNPSDLDNGQMDFEGHVSHTAQAAPITVQWLIDNFEPAEGCSLRRSTLYNYYLLHCTEQRIEPVNPASFGKLIRSVFLGLRTRRLGTRGNSKYHYYGIRVKASSPLNQIAEDSVIAMRNHPLSMSPTGSPHQPVSPTSSSATTASSSSHHHHTLLTQVSAQHHAHSNHNHAHSNGVQPPPSKRVKSSSGGSSTSTNTVNNGYSDAIEYKPNNLIPSAAVANNPSSGAHMIVDPNSGQQTGNLTTVVIANGANSINGKHLLVNPPSITKIVKNGSKPNGTSPNDQQLQQNPESGQFKPHTETEKEGQHAVESEEQDVSQITTLQMPDMGSVNLDGIQLPDSCTMDDVKKFEELYKQHCIEILDAVVGLKFPNIQSLWTQFWRSSDNEANQSNPAFYESQLASDRFFALCECSRVYEFVTQCDFQFYQFCIEILIPDVFGNLVQNLVSAMRTLSKNVESWLVKALQNVPEKMRSAKLSIIRAFSMTLKRYTSLSHLIQTVKNSLQNEELLARMSIDINKVDFSYIREQLRWTCDWENVEETVNRFETDFKDSLRNHDSGNMERWLSWIDNIVTSYMSQHENSQQSYTKMAKGFILTWSLLCDTTVRDLTLRSAPTFGSFHLVRLLYGEYINYLIEHKIADFHKKPPLQIMCPCL